MRYGRFYPEKLMFDSKTYLYQWPVFISVLIAFIRVKCLKDRWDGFNSLRGDTFAGGNTIVIDSITVLQCIPVKNEYNCEQDQLRISIEYSRLSHMINIKQKTLPFVKLTMTGRVFKGVIILLCFFFDLFFTCH